MPALQEVVDGLDRLYEPGWATESDAVGTVCGDPADQVHRVLFAVDPTLAVAEEAIRWGADLVVAHHPLLLIPVHGVAATTAKGNVVHRLISNGVALHVCHTNADVARPGVSDALGEAIGVRTMRPLEAAPAHPLDKLTTFLPRDAVQRLIDALAGAGAGAVGNYDRCAFTTTGTGSFRPREGANPTLGRIGEIEQVAETRVEMVLPRQRRAAVLAALRAAHPYEEPAYDLLELAAVPGSRGTGRIGELPTVAPLAHFAEQVATALPVTAAGLRVAGDRDQPVRKVALCAGAGDSLLDRVLSSDADVYVTSDLRHHRASEFREQALQRSDQGTALIDVSHWAAEWLWLKQAAAQLRETLGAAAATVETHVSTTRTDPWTFHVPQGAGPNSKESDG